MAEIFRASIGGILDCKIGHAIKYFSYSDLMNEEECFIRFRRYGRTFDIPIPSLMPAHLLDLLSFIDQDAFASEFVIELTKAIADKRTILKVPVRFKGDYKLLSEIVQYEVLYEDEDVIVRMEVTV